MESLRIIESVLGYSGDFFSALSSAEGGKSSRRQPCCCCPVTVQKEQQGIIRCRAGVGWQGSRAAMESPQALMCPLEKGVREMGGLTSRHQTTGRVRVFATANTWRTQRPHGVSGFGTESQ